MTLLQSPRSDGETAPPVTRRPTRTSGRRLSKGHWVALVVGLLAALVNIAVLRDRRDLTTVAVARERIEASDPVTSELVRWVEVPADSPLAEGLIDEASLSGEAVATRPIDAGEPLTSAALATDIAGDGLRSMSVPIAREHAAGGQLRPGDRVDVVDVVDGEAVYAVTDAEVLAVDAESAGALGADPGGFHVVVAVDDQEALRLAAALADDKLEIVRSTGAAAAATDEAGAVDGSDTEPTADGG